MTETRLVLDSLDYSILGCFAEKQTRTSWEIVKILHPNETNLNRYLSSVIFRLEKLRQQGFVVKRPHPNRKRKSIYDLNPQSVCLDGTFFIPSKIGGIILQCKFEGECKRPCRFGSEDCKLSAFIRENKIEPFIGLLEMVAKNVNIKSA